MRDDTARDYPTQRSRPSHQLCQMAVNTYYVVKVLTRHGLFGRNILVLVQIFLTTVRQGTRAPSTDMFDLPLTFIFARRLEYSALCPPPSALPSRALGEKTQQWGGRRKARERLLRAMRSTFTQSSKRPDDPAPTGPRWRMQYGREVVRAWQPPLVLVLPLLDNNYYYIERTCTSYWASACHFRSQHLSAATNQRNELHTTPPPPLPPPRDDNSLQRRKSTCTSPGEL